MIEPIKKFEIRGGMAFVYETGQTRYEDDEGDVIATLPFPVDEKNADLVLIAYQAGYDRGFAQGERYGRKALIGTIHELIGIDKITTALVEQKYS